LCLGLRQLCLLRLSLLGGCSLGLPRPHDGLTLSGFALGSFTHGRFAGGHGSHLLGSLTLRALTFGVLSSKLLVDPHSLSLSRSPGSSGRLGANCILLSSPMAKLAVI
jgi:hypothetical protein